MTAPGDDATGPNGPEDPSRVEHDQGGKEGFSSRGRIGRQSGFYSIYVTERLRFARDGARRMSP